MGIAAGGGERQVIVDAQIRAKPDQMGGHSIPFIMKIDKFDLFNPPAGLTFGVNKCKPLMAKTAG
jgi:hypothetical protein